MKGREISANADRGRNKTPRGFVNYKKKKKPRGCDSRLARGVTQGWLQETARQLRRVY